MKRVCFIIPYFGHLPNYFQLFLKTCKENKHFNWLIFTDDNTNFKYPSNVTKISMTFDECKHIIKSKFDCKININKPYKLCDLKPMYGYIFEEYIKEYKYWGHRDTDTLMGNLEKILTDEFLEEYDKFFCLGHMSIYKNNFNNNRIFMSLHNGKYTYKEVLANPSICWFDEEWNNSNSINQIFKEQGKKIFSTDLSLNISISYNQFRRTTFIGQANNLYEIEKPKKTICIWSNGNLYRIYKDKDKLIQEEFLYIHLQSRVMKMEPSILHLNQFKIIPDEFLPLEVKEVKINNFNKIKKRGICYHKLRLFKKHIIKRLNKYFINKHHPE